jgi:hypothetical protein
LRDEAVTINPATHARFNVAGYEDVIDLLARLCRERRTSPPRTEGSGRMTFT